MSSPLTQIKEIWNRLPMSGRISTVAGAVVTVGLLGAIIYYGSQPEYGVLFSEMKAEDAQAIVEKLKVENVPYSLSNSGTTVLVPHDRISELRLQMAGTGVLSGGHVGFDLFDKVSFGTTDFAQQVNYRRAIEGELAKTLEGMKEISSARVHITPKKDSIFSQKEEGAKASVMVRVRQDKELTSERTDAIVSLVSSSVEGLDPSSVSVMDTNGRLLSAGGGRGKGGAFNDAGAFHAKLEAQQKFEAENNARIVALLEPVVGEGRVRTNVSADIDFSQIEQTEEKYNPQSQVIRSQQTSQEARNSSSLAAITSGQTQGGTVGARSNDPTTPAAATTASPESATKTVGDQRMATTTNYEIDRTVKKTVGGGGQLNRLTVSVVVDNKIVNGVETARTAEELQKIQDLVGAAIGINPQRGDSVVVQTMAFNKPQSEAETPVTSFLDRNKQLVPNVIKYGALVLVAVLLLLFVIRPARRALKVASSAQPEPNLLLPGNTQNNQRVGEVNQLEGNYLPDGNPMMTVAELETKMNSENALVHPTVHRAENLKKMIAEQTMNNPEVVVSTLRSWLKEA
jgi:flagellar M-ring protein FliF